MVNATTPLEDGIIDENTAPKKQGQVSNLCAYPDDAFLKTLNLSDYELEFAQLEFGRGLPYYLQRLDRLLFKGARVLDAGCGVGQWSLALAQRFQQVDAIDLKGDRLDTLKIVVGRLGIDNVTIQQGSVTAIPFEENTFDAIFCYGVIMFTPIQETLKEFERVLKPGGRVYICLNGDGWFHYLKESREDAVTQKYMSHILAKTKLSRCLSYNSDADLKQWVDIWKSLLSLYHQFPKAFWLNASKNFLPSFLLKQALKKNPNLNVLYQAFKHQYGKSGVTVLTQQVVRIFQEKTEHDKCEKFLNFVINMLNWTQIGFQDSIHIKEVKLSKWIEVLEDDRMSDPTRGYFPEDLAPLLSQANLVDFQYAPESQLVCDLNIPSPHSMYAPYYKERLNVWEAVFAKPETFPDGMCPAAHYQAALLASQEPVYLSNASTPALSNGVTMNSYPPTLLAYAEEKAKHLGGRNHLKWLVEALTQQSQSETEKATALITFVQRAIYRDPISQPLTQDGQLPEAEVILQTHRGRCGHAVKLLSALFEIAGIEHETIQYPRHVALKAKVNGRWVLAETDAFKHGILPKGSDGQLLTMDELKANPRLLDRYPMTGWASLPNSPQSQDAFGHQVTGYIGAETFEQRGFLSGYFDETLIDFPPSLPEIQSADIVSRTPEGVQINLNWTPSQCLGEPLAYYGVTIGSHSRGWDYATPSTFNLVSTILPADCLKLETNETSLSVFIPQNKLNDLKDNTLFISITAFGSRIMQDPQTFYWPSDEYGLTLPQL